MPRTPSTVTGTSSPSATSSSRSAVRPGYPGQRGSGFAGPRPAKMPPPPLMPKRPWARYRDSSWWRICSFRGIVGARIVVGQESLDQVVVPAIPVPSGEAEHAGDEVRLQHGPHRVRRRPEPVDQRPLPGARSRGSRGDLPPGSEPGRGRRPRRARPGSCPPPLSARRGTTDSRRWGRWKGPCCRPRRAGGARRGGHRSTRGRRRRRGRGARGRGCGRRRRAGRTGWIRGGGPPPAPPQALRRASAAAPASGVRREDGGRPGPRPARA